MELDKIIENTLLLQTTKIILFIILILLLINFGCVQEEPKASETSANADIITQEDVEEINELLDDYPEPPNLPGDEFS